MRNVRYNPYLLCSSLTELRGAYSGINIKADANCVEVPISSITIEDENLKYCLSSYIDVSDVKHLSCDNINSLSDIDKLPNLQSLALYNFDMLNFS